MSLFDHWTMKLHKRGYKMGMYLGDPCGKLVAVSKRTGETVTISFYKPLAHWAVELESESNSYAGRFYSVWGMLSAIRRLERYHQLQPTKPKKESAE